MSIDRIPIELQELNQWVCWKVENNTKVPKVAAGVGTRNASTSNPKTWRSYDSAIKCLKKEQVDGIGFVFTENDPYIAIDLDNKKDDPEIEKVHRSWIQLFDSYTEISPSGTGYHIILRGDPIKGFNQSPYEAYYSGRYMTFTGNLVNEKPIKKNKKVLKEFCQELEAEKEKFELPEEIIEGNRNDTLFRLACSLMTRRVPPEEVVVLIKGFNRGLSSPLPEKEVNSLLTSAGSYDYEEEFDIFPWLINNMIWIAGQDKYWDWSQRGLISKQSLDQAYLKYIPKDDEGKRAPPSAWMRVQKDHQVVHDLGWWPDADLIYEWEGQDRINTYYPSSLVAKKGNITPWLTHLYWLIPNKEVAEHILDWMAYTVQLPGKKINFSLFIGGPERIGKDLLFAPLKKSLGEHNCKEINAPELEGEFNEYLWNTKLLTIGEMHTNISTARKVENKLKQMLTAPPNEIAINIKKVRRLTIPNLVSVIFFSNHRDALTITGNNAARYLCWWCDVERKLDSYYKKLGDWIEENSSAVLYFLKERNLSEFNPKGNAPENDFTREIVLASKDSLELVILESIENEDPPFNHDLVTVKEILIALDLPITMQQKVAKILRENRMLSKKAQLKGKPSKNLWAVRRTDTYKEMVAAELYRAYLSSRKKTKLGGARKKTL